jgi:DNA polymerase-3 subunit chi
LRRARDWGHLPLAMTEIHFYHLEAFTLERALPPILEKVLERGWCAVVHTGGEERTESLSAALWTFREDSFLPHGTPRDGHPDRQPVWFTETGEEPNRPVVRVCVDGVPVGDASGLERAIYVFDGREPEEVERAREQWKDAKARGFEVVYWQQDREGRWSRKQ